MKKTIALLLVLTMVSTLVACAGDGGGSSTTTLQEDAEASETEPESEGESTPADDADTSGESGDASLTVWCWDPAFNLYAMQEAEKVYQEENPDFSLTIQEVPWDDIQTRITTAMTSSDTSSLPDILLCQNNAFQKNVINYPDLFVDLTDSGIAFDQFGESSVAYSVIDGKNYGVPFDNGTAVMALRTDILEEAGYTIEDLTDITWAEFLTIGKDVLDKTGKPLMSRDSNTVDLFMMMLQSAGSSLFNADGSPNIKDNDVLKELIGVQVQLVEAGVITLVNNWDEYISTFINGEVAGTINGCWILASVQTAEDQSGQWGITNIPKLETTGATNYSANGGSSWGITINSQAPDLAIDFLSKTFAGSVPFYETILPASGALANYLPAGESAIYEEPQAFFGGQPIYSDIVTFSSMVPSNQPGVYYYEAGEAVCVALINVLNGGDLDTELQTAEDTLLFEMGG